MNSLGLNVIVGPGESFELNRLLESILVPGVFDQIVIVPTSHDPAVWEVAKKYTNDVFYFEWCDDFAAARNHALEHTNTKYVMWADADDVMCEASRERMTHMRDHMFKGDFDVYLVPYHLDFDESGNTTQFLPRDRIFKRQKSLMWFRAVHEQLSVNTKKHVVARFEGIWLEHRPTKEGNTGLHRNLRILEASYNNDPSDAHTAFYYARDKYLVGDRDEAVVIFDRIVQERKANRDNLVVASVQAAMYYTYRDERSLRVETLDRGENYARIAMSFSEKYAEPYVVLGDIYHHRGMAKEAVGLYKRAMGKKLDGNGLQQVPYYEEVPADRLATVLLNEGEWWQAGYYNSLVMKHAPNEPRLHERERAILEQISAK